MFQPSKRAITAGHFKLINGIWHKRCTGPAHDEPAWLPATEKYFYVRKSANRRGLLHSRCRLCQSSDGILNGTQPGLVPYEQVVHLYREAIARVGMMEFSRRIGMHYTSIENVLNGKVKMIRKSTLRKIILELISMRRKNEHSINHQSKWRNQRRLRPKNACAECGTNIENYTDGCDTCSDRKGIKKKWAGMTPEQKFTANKARVERRRKQQGRSKEAA